MNDIVCECSICTEEIGVWDRAVVRCGHKFHLSCLFATRNPFCPYCRCDMRLNPNLPKIPPTNDVEKVSEQLDDLGADSATILEAATQRFENDPEQAFRMDEEEEEYQKLKKQVYKENVEKIAKKDPVKGQLFAKKKY